MFHNVIKVMAILFIVIHFLFSSENGSVVGHISDRETGDDIGWTSVLLEEINRSVSAHSDGDYHLFDIPAGKYTLKVFRIGYHNYETTVDIQADKTITKNIQLSREILYTEDVLVESEKYKTKSKLQQPDITLSGKKLRQNIGLTIAETINDEPGLSQRTMGPAPARPVLRGLSGDRLLMLEDGERTGDLSATSSDHAVVIDPMNADRIEVIRGPEALLFGSNTLGGVINVNRNYILSMLPHRVTGNLAFHSGSVNAAKSGSMKLTVPIQKFAIKIDGSQKYASDINTPIGTLQNTNIETNNFSSGLTYFAKKFSVGSAYSFYNSDYGIPPQPDSLGGHPNGVDIEMQRKHVEIKLDYFPKFDWLHFIEMKHSYKRYQHAEFESNGQVGMRFGVLTHDFSAKFHLAEKGVFSKGVIGLWAQHRDYATSGLTFTPASIEKSFALFHYNEHKFGRIAFNAAIRYDFKYVTPEEEKIIERADYYNHIRKRSFNDYSASFSTVYDLRKHCSLGISIMRAYRAPGIEELFSEGPHLAAYSYEVGNANLKEETALGTELFFDIKRKNFRFHLATFRNDINNYIFPVNTGRRSLRIASLFLYQYAGKDVIMNGVESSLEWHFLPSFLLNYTIGYTEGKLVNENEYLPQIPPLESKIEFQYEKGALTLGTAARMATEQNKIGEFESPTDGYMVLDINGQYYFKTGKYLHTISVSILNVGNTEYRHHLNRIKDIFPEPGRNFKLLYKIFF